MTENAVVVGTKRERERRLGNIFNATGGNHAGMVYDKFALAPTLNAMQGGYREPMFLEVRKIG